MDVSNASGYDGTTVAADACYVAKSATGRGRVVVTEATNPQVRAGREDVRRAASGSRSSRCRTTAATTDPDRVREAAARRRRGDLPAAELLRLPRAGARARRRRERRAARFPIAHVDLISLGRARGARQLRLRARDRRGTVRRQLHELRRPALRLPRRPRPVHPEAPGPDRRRDGRRRGETAAMSSPCRRASSTSGARRRRRTSPPTRPCSPWRAWCTSRCSGPQGLRETGETCMALAAYAKERLEESGVKLLFPRTDNVQGVCRRRRTERHRRDPRRARARRQPRLRARPRLPGPRERPPRRGHREAHDRGDRPAREPLSAAMKLIYEKSRPGRRGLAVPRPDLPVPAVPPELARTTPPRLPELAEPEVLRHFTELSTRNFGIDTGFYPLGSCTMKYNPRVNERARGASRLPRPASARRRRRRAGRARARVGARRRSCAR